MWISSCFLSIAIHVKVLFKKQASYVLTYIYAFSYFYFLWLRNYIKIDLPLEKVLKVFLTLKSVSILTWVHRECWYSLGLSLLLPKSSGHEAEVGMSQSVGGFPAENAVRLAWACPLDQFVLSSLKRDTHASTKDPQLDLHILTSEQNITYLIQFYYNHTTRDVWLNFN